MPVLNVKKARIFLATIIVKEKPAVTEGGKKKKNHNELLR